MKRLGRIALRLVRFEVDSWVSLFRWVTRRPVYEGGLPIPYAGALSAVLWAFVIVSAIEIPVVHLLLPWQSARIAALILGVWGLTWMIGLLACYTVHPHALTEDVLHVRFGRRFRVDIPLATIAGIRHDHRSPQTSRSPHQTTTPSARILHVPVAASTNLHIRLSEPRTFVTSQGTFTVDAIAIWADDPHSAVNAYRAAIDATAH